MKARPVALLALGFLTYRSADAETLREKHLRWGEHFLLPDAQHTASTPHFVVTTDSPHAKTAQNVAQNLEATFALIERFLAPAKKPIEMKEAVAVYAFRSGASFDGFREQVGASPSMAGLFLESGVMAFSLDAAAVEPLVATMIHEATHAYLAELCRPGRIQLPLWLEEGFATYVGNSELRRDELILGSRTGSATYHANGWSYGVRSNAKIGGKLVRSAQKKKSAIAIGALMRADPDAFYGERASLYYSQAWILVHFLIHGQPGWDTQRFPALIQRVIEGQPAADAVRIVYGLQGKELSDAYFDYVSSF